MNTTHLSKNQIATTKFHSYSSNYEWNYHSAYLGLVWLEDYERAIKEGGKDPVSYATTTETGRKTFHPKLCRTKYKVYTHECHTGVGANNHTLVEELASYDPFLKTEPHGWNEKDTVFRGAFYKDKPVVAKAVREASDKARAKFATTKTTNATEKSYEYNDLFVRECLKAKIKERSLLVVLLNKPIHHESYCFSAYLPREGFFVSHPKFSQNAEGHYVITITLNQKEQTEECCEFIEKENLAGHATILSHTNRQRIFLREEGSTVNTDIYHILNEMSYQNKKFPTKMLLKRVSWSIWDGVESIEIVRGGDNSPLSALKKNAYKQGTFQEELVQAVFHPDRVARLVGDNWGKEESWLNQI